MLFLDLLTREEADAIRRTLTPSQNPQRTANQGLAAFCRIDELDKMGQ